MGKFNMDEADNYGGNGGGGFFSLKNDKDVATVRFMYNTIADIHGYAVHEIEVDGKKRYINCLRAYNEPVDNCPLCASGAHVLAKFFINLYDEETGEIKVWDRGKTFRAKLASLGARYNPLVSTPFEIERNGKKGDTNTTYETYALQTDNKTLEDLPEVPELLGTLILDKTYEEIEDFLTYGTFAEEETAQPPVTRRNTRAAQPEAPQRRAERQPDAPATTRSGQSPMPPRRRTTGNTNGF